mmetsp:Transcript_32823/g.47387  ORF Transcript_32823/g.47387 Transcript_32823/m.47387 type:complete len:616 (-) Transcript_32823:38-1885(-)
MIKLYKVRQWLYLLLQPLLFSHSFYSNDSLELPSFCELDSLQSRLFNKHFPSVLPEDHLPWLWDAVYTTNSLTSNLVITTIPKKNCLFNYDIVEEFLKAYPAYAESLGGGLRGNILVPYEKEEIELFDYVGTRNASQGILGKSLMCNLHKGSKIVYKTLSEPIVLSASNYAEQGPVQITCPNIPAMRKHNGDVEWDSVSLERDIEPLLKPGIRFYSNRTEAVPVCQVPPLSSLPLYELSICSTVFRSNKDELLEWLEYHLLMGVDHFFLYNLAVETHMQRQLEALLAKYRAEGLVTLVSWPYSNCIRHMETARPISFRRHCGPNTTNFRLEAFLPTSIAQAAATASCFSRFKGTTKYMGHLDIDEFFLVRGGNTRGGKRTEQQGFLKTFVQRQFKRHPKAPAMAFSPVSMLECEQRLYAKYGVFLQQGVSSLSHFMNSSSSSASANVNESIQYLLPRLGKHQYSEPGVRYEVKLIVRSEAVNYLFTHYLSQLSSADWNMNYLIQLPPKQAALLHFRSGGGVAGTHFGCKDRLIPLEEKQRNDIMERCKNSLPMTLDRGLQQLLSQQPENVVLMKTKLERYTMKDRLDYFLLGFDSSTVKVLVEKYLNRREQVVIP